MFTVLYSKAFGLLRSQYWEALKYASNQLRGDRDIVLKAVSLSGKALKYATEDLKADPKIMMKVVSQVAFSLILRVAFPFRGNALLSL